MEPDYDGIPILIRRTALLSPTLGLLWAPTSNHLSLLEAWKLTQFNFRLLSIFLLDS